jgi:hypothetical protein
MGFKGVVTQSLAMTFEKWTSWTDLKCLVFFMPSGDSKSYGRDALQCVSTWNIFRCHSEEWNDEESHIWNSWTLS